MSSKLIKLAKSLSFQLSAWYLAIFTFSAVVLFIFLYLLLAATAENKDRELIQARLNECATVYGYGGVSGLQDLLNRSMKSDEAKSFFIRLASDRGSVLLLTAPQDWIHFDMSALQRGNPSGLVWLRIPKDEERDFFIASEQLPDGVILQVGRSTNSRVRYGAWPAGSICQ